MIGAVEPPGDGTTRVGDMTGKGGRVHIKFDDMVGFPETFFDIAIINIGIGNVPFFGRIVASPPFQIPHTAATARLCLLERPGE